MESPLRRSIRLPYGLLLIAAVLLAVVSWFDTGKTNIHFYGTYFQVYNASFYRLQAFIVLGLWLTYMLASDLLPSRALKWVHILSIVIYLVPIIFPEMFAIYSDPLAGPQIYNSELSVFAKENIVVFVFGCIVVIGHIAFLLNFFTGMGKWLGRRVRMARSNAGVE